MTADPRARWAELLRAPADAPAEAAASAFVRALPRDGFLPAPERAAAVNALAGTAVPTGRDDDVARLLRDEVEAFATNYWALAPAARRAAWAELSRRGAAPARLRELESGLDATPPTIVDPVAEELAALFRTLFALPARERAIRRNGWVLAHAADAGRWRSALAVVQRDAPALASLEPHLRTVLAPGYALAAFIEGATTTARPEPSEAADAAVAEGVAGFARRLRKYEREVAEGGPVPRRPYSGERADRAFGRGFAALAIGFVALVMFKAVVNRAGSDTTTYKPPNHATSDPIPPPFNPPRDQALPPPYTFGEVAQFQQYERDKDAGRNPAVPVGYPGWRLAGRPGNTPIPKPGERAVYMDIYQIVACQKYERTKVGSPPPHYDDWVRAGKPGTSGFVRVSTSP